MLNDGRTTLAKLACRKGGCCVEPIVSLSVWDIVSRARTTYFTLLFLKFRTSRSSFEQRH